MIGYQQNVDITLKHLLSDFANMGKASLMKRKYVLEQLIVKVFAFLVTNKGLHFGN